MFLPVAAQHHPSDASNQVATGSDSRSIPEKTASEAVSANTEMEMACARIARESQYGG
jgi:hypothetical protein